MFCLILFILHDYLDDKHSTGINYSQHADGHKTLSGSLAIQRFVTSSKKRDGKL